MSATIRPGGPADRDAILAIARELPEWFTDRGVRQLEVDLAYQPTLVACAGSQVVGFVSFYVAEAVGWIAWLGVSPGTHRSGVGRALVEHLAGQLTETGVVALRADTLGDSVEYEPYAKTRAFYAAVGFEEHARQVQDDPEWPDRLTFSRELHPGR